MSVPHRSAEGRVATIKSPLSDGKLRFKSIEGEEVLGRPFRYTLVAESLDANLTLDDLGGKKVTVLFETEEGNKRHICGFVSALTRTVGLSEAGDFNATYQMELVPWFALLAQRADCRVFASLDGKVKNSAKDIITKVFEEAGHKSDADLGSLEATYPDLEYVAQYSESDFNFASRLMEREGIYYFFEHKDGDHKMILADSSAAHKPFDGYDAIPYVADRQVAQVDYEAISKWQVREAVRTTKVHQTDYDYNEPTKDLANTVNASGSHPKQYEWYEYPGRYAEKSPGKRYAEVRLEERRTEGHVVSGKTNALGLATGYRFKLGEAIARSDEKEYVVIGHTIRATSTNPAGGMGAEISKGDFEITFQAIPADEKFRPRRVTPVPVVHGPHNAVVVGQKGEEITTEKLGRVKISFFWDRKSKQDETASCWVRVAQGIAHENWGMQYLPRHGQEVLVEYVDGDIDRPIITGSVYNGKSKPTYDLPANKSQSGYKSQSTKEGTKENFNEIRFEDKKGEEELYIHAEKNQTTIIENDQKIEIGLEKKDKGDQTVEIHNDRTTTLNEGNDKLQIKKGDRELLIDDGERTTTIKKDDTVTIDGGQTIKVKKKVLIDAGDEITLKSGQASIVLKKDGTITIKGMKITTEGQQSVTIKGTSKVDVKGMQVAIKGDMKAELAATMTDVKGDAMLKCNGGITKIN